MELASLLFFFAIIVPSAIIHEYFHAWTANYFGDPTPKYAGRLTLNPAAHIDPWGTIMMPLLLFFASGGSMMFAYAKPVPINPLYMRGQHSSIFVAAAGPLSNFGTALVVALIIRLIPVSTFSSILSLIVYANILLGLFNLIPIPPLDGSKIIIPLIPSRWSNVKFFLEQYGFFILLIFIFFGFGFIAPLVLKIYRLFVGGGGLPF